MQRELHAEQHTTGREQRADAGHRTVAQRPGERLHGEHLDDEVERPHEVGGQVEQVGDPVVDRAAGVPGPRELDGGGREVEGDGAVAAGGEQLGIRPEPGTDDDRPPAAAVTACASTRASTGG